MNKNKGKIIIVEGIWGAGKSTLIKNAFKALKARHIPEPNHIKSKTLSENPNFLTKWYFKAHYKNLKKAEVIARAGKTVFIERCPLSSMVFLEAYLNKRAATEMLHFKHCLKGLRKRKISIYLIYLKPKKNKTVIKTIKQKFYLNPYAKISFLQSLDCQLWLLIQKLEKAKLISVYKNPAPKSLINFIYNKQ